MEIRFERRASKDYLESARWYRRKSTRAALRFVTAVDAALQRAAAEPYRWPKVDDKFRWITVERFPYVLYYQIVTEETVVVLAIAHTSRRPGYWKRRAKR